MSEPFGGALSVAQQRFSRKLQEEHECVRCHLHYTELENMGRHLCRAYHPQIIANSNGVYTCCNRRTGDDGCVKADHTTGEFNKMGIAREQFETKVLSEEALLMASLLKQPLDQVKLDSWRADNKTRTFHVSRVDYAARRTAMYKS